MLLSVNGNPTPLIHAESLGVLLELHRDLCLDQYHSALTRPLEPRGSLTHFTHDLPILRIQ